MRVATALAGLLVLAASAGAAPDRVTIAVMPSIMEQGGVVHLTGKVDGAGEAIKIDMRECGALRFHQVEGAHSGPDGSWVRDTKWAIGNTWYRARWRDEVSAPVRVMVRAKAILETISLPSGRAYKASPIGGAPKGPILQRLNRRLGKWEQVRILKLNKYGAYVFRYSRHGDQIRVWVRGDRCWVPGPSIVLTT